MTPPEGPAQTGGPHHTEELAVRAAAGDQRALDELLRTIRPEVVRRCGRFLLYQEDAEEAAQDTLLQVSRNIGRFEGRSKFSTWLHTITANCARQKYRELKRRAQEMATPPSETSQPVDPRTTSVIAGSRLDLLDALERLERDSPHLVTPLVYRDICGMEYAEIVERLGIPLGTVKSRLHNARRQIRPWLSNFA
ncbi:RNA polymerase sigma factor [Streptomyces tsukubensis]|uniref:RNA polymerase subunit sigma-24 n=1 Tax=Streptomyces tsukubensis TaxID=83656 RepID=A0A1V4A4E9_9ACTN|nr:sigma-70 family RNA polymerase sigma factor [Streptomyces tsukubensis]OON75582.1 RNA polymerase subunit sigma-24 [Streptomyces tsukubensis]QFR94438.1 sigma-70 family RNA polymerase sigma factor [Streptomyces tsukubensis]